MRLSGKTIAPMQSNMHIHPATVLVLHKFIASINMLSGKSGPVANNNMFELTGYLANSWI